MSCEPAETRSTEPDAVLALGKALVEQLKQSGSVDITAQWMAHHLAELMERARTATGLERQQANKEAAALILDLWRHRTYLPGRYPLASFEPVLQTLERLSDNAPWHRFFTRRALNGEEDTPIHQWLKRAEAIDDASRKVIRSCLMHAVDAAGESEGKYLDLLEDLESLEVLEDKVPTVVIRLVGLESDEKDEKNTPEVEALAALDFLRQELSASIERLKDNIRPHKSPQPLPGQPEE
jgi:hypothetical protein